MSDTVLDRQDLEDLATADARRDHQRGTLELIAGTKHQHDITLTIEPDDDEIVISAKIAKVRRALDEITTIGYVDDCPACMAKRCLEQVDAAEAAELGQDYVDPDAAAAEAEAEATSDRKVLEAPPHTAAHALKGRGAAEDLDVGQT